MFGSGFLERRGYDLSTQSLRTGRRVLRSIGHLHDHDGDCLSVIERLAGCGLLLQSRQSMSSAAGCLLHPGRCLFSHDTSSLPAWECVAGCADVL